MGVLWVNNLSGGMNHRSPGLLAEDQAEMLVNISQAQLGNWAHRLGTELFLDSVSASAPVRGLGMFKKNNGSKYFHMVNGGNLYVNDVAAWSSQASSEWSTSSEIDMTNFIGRHYMASSTAGEYIRYFTETGGRTYLKLFTTTASASSSGTTLVASTSVFNAQMVGMTVFNTSDGTSAVITVYTSATTVTVDTSIGNDWDGDNIEMRLDGKYLAVNGAYMMISGNSVYPRRTYFTNVDSETINVETDYFITSEPPTGLTSFGNGRAFVIFTGSNYLVADPASIYTNEVEGFGCVSHRSIQNIKGNVIFMDNNAYYMLSANSSYPTDISLPIKNDLSGDAIINEINVSNLTLVASGVIDTRYYSMLRDMSGTVYGETLESTMVEIDVSQNNWKVNTFTTNDIGSVFSLFTDSTGTFLYSGSWSNGTVYKMEVPGVFTDDNRTGSPQTVTSKVKTKHYEFINKGDGAIVQKTVRRLHFKYYSASDIDVKYALDGATTYSVRAGDTLTLPDYTSTRWTWDYLDIGEDCKSISLQLQSTGQFIIYAIGFEVITMTEPGIRGS